jgi:hypothetical protein
MGKDIFKPNKMSETKHVHPWFKKELLKRWPKAFVYKPPAGRYGRKGVHDFLLCIDGKFISVEAKLPDNEMTPMQVDIKVKIEEAGGLSLCLKGKDKSIFDRISEWLKD